MRNFCQGARFSEKAVTGSIHLTKPNKIGDSNATTIKPPRMRMIPAKIQRISTDIQVKTPKSIAARPRMTVPIFIDHCISNG